MEDKIWLEGWLNNIEDKSKISTAKAKSIALNLYSVEIVNSIFDPNDTCFCSVRMRILYKQKFKKYYYNEKETNR